MRIPFGIRVWILLITLCLFSAGILFELSTAWHHVQELEAKLTSAQIASFRLAGQVQREVLNLNNAVLRYVLVRDPHQWDSIDRATTELDEWTDDNDPTLNPASPLTTERERHLFTELNQAFNGYRDSVRALHANAMPALLSTNQLTQLDSFDKQAARMRDLAHDLTDAHRTAEKGFLAAANASLNTLRRILTFGLLILLFLMGTIGWVIYRDTIAPLRTKLVRSQRLLEKQEKLATLGTLAAGIAHEIRNPLTSLKARLYTLEKHLTTTPAARKDTDIINAEISRLERIVRDVLSFARPSDPQLDTVAADTIVQEVQGLMAPHLESRGIEISVERNPELFVRADTGHLKQVLINLVRNSADAIEGAGKIILRTQPSRARIAERESDVVIFEVQDNGRGIPKEVENRLFDPFFSTKETGTGLGLTIAARIIEKHGGVLRYQTQPGYGTTFGVVLPRMLPQDSGRATDETKA